MEPPICADCSRPLLRSWLFGADRSLCHPCAGRWLGSPAGLVWDAEQALQRAAEEVRRTVAGLIPPHQQAKELAKHYTRAAHLLTLAGEDERACAVLEEGTEALALTPMRAPDWWGEMRKQLGG